MGGDEWRNILVRVLEGFEETLGNGRGLVETEVVEEFLQNGLVDDELGDIIVLRVGWMEETE